jgi:threonyl-tRNA synthetase
MCQNDGHIYCSEEQIDGELATVLEMHRKVYQLLDLKNYQLRLSIHDPSDPKKGEKFVDDPKGWEHAERKLRDALKAADMPYVEGKGEAAFYGPKIDFQFRTVTGREETASTLQLDFAMSRRLGLVYTGPDNREHHPFILHRAPLGTHERLTAFLIEHYGGAFPTWLAPVQVRVIAVSDRSNDYAEKIVGELRGRMVRAEIDSSPETMSKKIRLAVMQKIPNVLVAGEREQAENTVTLRRYGVREQESMALDSFVKRIVIQIDGRSF